MPKLLSLILPLFLLACARDCEEVLVLLPAGQNCYMLAEERFQFDSVAIAPSHYHPLDLKADFGLDYRFPLRADPYKTLFYFRDGAIDRHVVASGCGHYSFAGELSGNGIPVLKPGECYALTDRKYYFYVTRPEPKFDTQLLVNSAQYYPSREVKLDGVTYQHAFRDSVLLHRTTNDPNFRSPEGLAVGDSLPKGECVNEPGWGTYVRLPSGWNASAYCDGGCDCGSTEIQWFFQRL